MFGKILLTAIVILGTYLVIRARMQRSHESAPIPKSREPLLPQGVLKAVAYGLVATSGAGSLLWLYLSYEAGQEVVTVRIINANTGEVATYQARRAEVKGRHFTTLDGHPITIADVDRLELGAAP